MAVPSVLLTGGTGYIGFKVLLEALRAGYTVRAAVRSLSKAENTILSNHAIKEIAPGNRLTFIEVPDILIESAYDEAMKDISYVIHVASPLPAPFKNAETEIFQPGVKGTNNILASALKTPSLKRLIITSAIVANMPYPPPSDLLITAESRVATPTLDGPYTEAFTAYCASKISTLNTTDEFFKKHNPPFSIVNIIPGLVIGRDEKATGTTSLLTGTNRLLLALVTGQSFNGPRLAGAAHVNDVAKVHLLALKDDKIKGREDFGVTSPMLYDDAWEIIKKHFPKAVEEGTFTQGHQSSLVVNWDAGKTQERFGFKFQTWEDMVVDVATQYLEFMGKDRA